jgi:Helix-turn-helix domain
MSEHINIRDERDRPWSWFDNGIIQQYGKEIGPYGIAVYMALLTYVDRQRECYPSLTTLSKVLGIGRAKLVSTLKLLAARGLVRMENRQLSFDDQPRRRASNLYTILNPWVIELEDQPPLTSSPRKPVKQETSSPRKPVTSSPREPELEPFFEPEPLKEPPPLPPTADAAEGSPPVPPAPRPRKKIRRRDLPPYESAPGFARLWEVAGKRSDGSKGSKQEAFYEYLQLRPNPEHDPAMLETLLAAYIYQKTTPQWQAEHGRFIPSLDVWLFQRRWEGVDLTAGPVQPPPLPKRRPPGTHDAYYDAARGRWIFVDRQGKEIDDGPSTRLVFSQRLMGFPLRLRHVEDVDIPELMRHGWPTPRRRSAATAYRAVRSAEFLIIRRGFRISS